MEGAGREAVDWRPVEPPANGLPELREALRRVLLAQCPLHAANQSLQLIPEALADAWVELEDGDEAVAVAGGEERALRRRRLGKDAGVVAQALLLTRHCRAGIGMPRLGCMIGLRVETSSDWGLDQIGS